MRPIVSFAAVVVLLGLPGDKESGTVEAGKRADLIVVEGDRPADIRALRRVTTVVKAGRLYDPAKLWKIVGFQP